MVVTAAADLTHQRLTTRQRACSRRTGLFLTIYGSAATRSYRANEARGCVTNTVVSVGAERAHHTAQIELELEEGRIHEA